MTGRKFFTSLIERWYVWLFLAIAVIDWVLLQQETVDHPYWVLTILVALAVVGWAAETIRTIALARRREVGRVGAAGRLMILIGLVVMFGSGVANWLWSLQGYVVLKEAEAVPLYGGAHTMAFESGPLSTVESLHFTLQLEELTIVPTPGGGLYPQSRLRIQGTDGRVTVTDVSPRQIASYGSLRLYQGAFGFAPRIVILKDGKSVFDEVVQFMTRVHDDDAFLSFEEAFIIEDEGIEVWGGVDLSSLDDAFRGHAMLALSVRRGERLLGQGRLSVGHFADIEDGYRIGFAGLQRWSEIDFSRRNYRRQMLWASVLVLAGLMTVMINAVVIWRRGAHVE